MAAALRDAPVALLRNALAACTAELLPGTPVDILHAARAARSAAVVGMDASPAWHSHIWLSHMNGSLRLSRGSVCACDAGRGVGVGGAPVAAVAWRLVTAAAVASALATAGPWRGST